MTPRKLVYPAKLRHYSTSGWLFRLWRIYFSKSMRVWARILPARYARALHLLCPPLVWRAQGRPGACCTRGLACDLRKQNCTRAYRAAGASRPSLRNGFTAYFVLFPENGSFASVACASYRTLNASTAAPEPHDFAVRCLARTSSAHSASTASHRTFVTIAKRPSSAVRQAELCD